MAHNLEIKNGKASCYLHKLEAWHKLGTVSDISLPFDQVMEIAGMNFTVSKESIFADLGKKGKSYIPGKAATVRSDNGHVLGVVGEEYGLIQFSEVFQFCQSLGEFMNDLTYESAIILGRGERFAIGIKMGDEFNFEGDKVYPYLYINGSFDGSLRHSILPTSIREVCQNTQRMAITAADKSAFFFKHTSGITDRIETAKKTIVAASTSWRKQKEDMRSMAETKIGDSEVDQLIRFAYAKPDQKASDKAKTRHANITSDIFKIWNSDTCKGIGGSSLWTGFNAVTEYMDHNSSMMENVTDETGNKTKLSEEEIAQNRFDSNVLGKMADKKADLFDYALSMAD